MYLRAMDAIAARFRDPQVIYMIETFNEPSTELPHPVILRGVELDCHSDLRNARLSSENAQEADAKSLACLHFCSKSEDISSFTSIEEVDFMEKLLFASLS